MKKKIAWIVTWFMLVFFSIINTCNAFAQVEIEKTPAKIKKIQMIYGEFEKPVEYVPLSFIAISETDSTMLIGNTNYQIAKIITTDSVTTYLAKDIDNKEFVYDSNKNTLTQRNIAKDRRTGELQKGKFEVWFVYTLIIKNENEFELGGL